MKFAIRCPCLEIIRWNYYNRHPEYNNAIEVDGYELQSMNNLKELYFDNHYFGFHDDQLIDEDENYAYDNGDDDDNGVSEIEAMSNSNNYPNIFFSKNCASNHWNGYRFETHDTRTPITIDTQSRNKY